MKPASTNFRKSSVLETEETKAELLRRDLKFYLENTDPQKVVDELAAILDKNTDMNILKLFKNALPEFQNNFNKSRNKVNHCVRCHKEFKGFLKVYEIFGINP